MTYILLTQPSMSDAMQAVSPPTRWATWVLTLTLCGITPRVLPTSCQRTKWKDTTILQWTLPMASTLMSTAQERAPSFSDQLPTASTTTQS